VKCAALVQQINHEEHTRARQFIFYQKKGDQSQMKTKLKKFIEKTLDDEYPGVCVLWQGDNPTLIIPDNLKNDGWREVVSFAEALWKIMGGEVVFDCTNIVS
jgi:hypothetical protein